jgi:alpha-beta hydrolase superfamily lysophospholipase
MAKKIKVKKTNKKKRKISYINVIRRITGRIYLWLENLLKPNWVTRLRIKKGKLDIPLELAKMNRIMNWWYKRPELKISDAKPLEHVTFKTKDDLNISGVIYRGNPDSKKWVVACHWFGGHKYWALYNTIMFRKMGYNVLAIDFRGHGESDNDLTSMGAREVYDVMSAIQYLNDKEKVDQIALYGISMGAFSISYLSVMDPEFCHKNKVKFGICDSAYESIFTLLNHVRDKHLIVIPKRKARQQIIKIMEHHNRLETNPDIDWFATSVITKIKLEHKKPAFPILFMHAQNDKVTNPIDSYRVFAERAKLIEGDDIWTFKYGTHALMTKEHFKEVERHIGEYIAVMDDNNIQYEAAESELQLTVKDKRDQKEDALL